MLLSSFIAYLVLILPGISYDVGLFSLLFCVFYSTLKNPKIGLVIITFLSASYILVRWKDPSSLLLAGFRTEIFFLFSVAYLIRGAILKSKKKTYASIRFPREILLYLFISWSLFCFFIHSQGNYALFLLGIRENLEAWLLFPLIVNILKENIDLFKVVILSLILGSSFVALFNVLNYYELIDLPFNSYAIRGNYIHTRTLLGLSVNRMNAFFGIGPSGGGQYFAVIAVQNYLYIRNIGNKMKIKNLVLNFLLITSLLLLIWAAILTLSVSLIGVIALSVFSLNVKLNLKSSSLAKNFFAILLVFFLTLSVDLNQFGINYSNAFIYFNEAFFNKGLDVFYNIDNLLFGQGLALRTGTSIVESEASRLAIDISWFVLALRMGIIGMVLGVAFIVSYLYSFINFDIKLHHEKYIFAGVLLFSLMSYVHTSPLITRPFDYLLVIAISTLHVIYKKDKHLA